MYIYTYTNALVESLYTRPYGTAGRQTWRNGSALLAGTVRTPIWLESPAHVVHLHNIRPQSDVWRPCHRVYIHWLLDSIFLRFLLPAGPLTHQIEQIELAARYFWFCHAWPPLYTRSAWWRFILGTRYKWMVGGIKAKHIISNREGKIYTSKGVYILGCRVYIGGGLLRW
jgi:hypothetical protein